MSGSGFKQREIGVVKFTLRKRYNCNIAPVQHFRPASIVVKEHPKTRVAVGVTGWGACNLCRSPPVRRHTRHGPGSERKPATLSSPICRSAFVSPLHRAVIHRHARGRSRHVQCGRRVTSEAVGVAAERVHACACEFVCVRIWFRPRCYSPVRLLRCRTL